MQARLEHLKSFVGYAASKNVERGIAPRLRWTERQDAELLLEHLHASIRHAMARRGPRRHQPGSFRQARRRVRASGYARIAPPPRKAHRALARWPPRSGRPRRTPPRAPDSDTCRPPRPESGVR